MQFVLVEDKNEGWGWQLRSGDDILAVSPVTYSSLEAVLMAVEELKSGVGSASLPDIG